MVGVLNSVVSVYYYLRIVVAMYFRERAGIADAYAPFTATFRAGAAGGGGARPGYLARADDGSGAVGVGAVHHGGSSARCAAKADLTAAGGDE